MKTINEKQLLTFIEKQREHIEQEVNETIFPDIQYQNLVPVDTSAPEWVRTITYYGRESYGDAKWINGNADDIPLAGNFRTRQESTVHMAGVGYGFGYQELQEAIQLGINLPSEDAVAARETYERFVDDLTFLGDDSKGMTGLINAEGVSITSATGTFAEQAEEVVLKDINQLLLGDGKGLVANTLLIPFESLAYLASTSMGSKAGTILDFIRANNVYTATTGQPLIIRALDRLTNAAEGGAANRAVAYTRNPRVLKLHIPMPHTFLPTYQTGAMNFVVGGIFRVGGLEIRNTGGIRYLDGV